MKTKFNPSSMRTTVGLIFCLLLLVFLAAPRNINGLTSVPSNLNIGPYVDEVIYRVIANQDQRVLELQAGTIEMDRSFFDPVYLEQLEADPDVSIYQGIRNGYGHITINCEKYPLNISGFRRAFAFAYDKERVTAEVMDGFNIEHDSLVPYPNGWCAEEEFDFHYYTAQPDIGNQILDDLGFEIDGSTGFRNAPDGTPFEIQIEYASPGGISSGSAFIGVDALHSLHIDARTHASDFNEYISRLDNHGDYDMVFYAVNFYTNDVDWLAYEYWSENADVMYENPTNFRNATYDSWRDQLLYGTTYEEVYEAAAEMQKILHYNVPRLVVYENMYMQGYRNDVFTGHVEDLLKHISGPWTMRKIQKLDGTFGGTVAIAISQEPDSFNFYVTNSGYSAAILDNLWPSLYKHSPELTQWPDLAESMVTETSSDNPSVPDDHTRFTIDIIRNATWSDGEPITAKDVAFTFTYALESGVYGSPAGVDLGGMVAAYATTDFRVVIEFNTESYWHFSNFAYDTVIPEHIFNDDTGIGYEGWNTWNPVFDPAEPNVNCGPFTLTDYEAGEYYTITKNPLFHYYTEPYTPPTETTSTTTTSGLTTITTTLDQTNESTMPLLEWSRVFSASLISGSTIVILFCIVIIVKERQK